MKRIVAREWLTLVGCVLFGGIVLMILSMHVGPPRRDEWDVYVVFLTGPYVIYQFIRSIAWATIATSTTAGETR